MGQTRRFELSRVPGMAGYFFNAVYPRQGLTDRRCRRAFHNLGFPQRRSERLHDRSFGKLDFKRVVGVGAGWSQLSFRCPAERLLPWLATSSKLVPAPMNLARGPAACTASGTSVALR